MDDTAKYVGPGQDVPPKASKCAIRKVSGGFIVEYEVPCEPGPNWQAQSAYLQQTLVRPTVTREHVVADLSALDAFLATLLR